MSIFEKYNSNLKIVYKNYRMVTSRKLIKKGDLHKWYYCYNQKLHKQFVSLTSGAIEMIFSVTFCREALKTSMVFSSVIH